MKIYKFPQLTQAMCKTTFYTMGPGAAKKHLYVISKWIKHIGVRQTAKRLKCLMVVINLRLDNQLDKSDVYLYENTHLTWKSKSLNTFRFLYNSLKTCKSNYKASRLYTVLKLYTGLDYTNEIKLKDQKKLLDTVILPEKDKLAASMALRRIIKSRNSTNQIDFDSQLLVDILRQASPFVKTNVLKLRPNKVRYINNNITIPQGKTNIYHNIGYKMASDLIRYKPPYWVTVEDYRDSSLIDINTILDHSLSLGYSSKQLEQYDASISIIPKPGSDGRVIAKLPLIIQMLMSNFHDILETFREKYSNIFYWKRQHEMADRARYSKTRCSTDLSAATDRIPRDLFIMYIRHLMTNEKVKKFAFLKYIKLQGDQGKSVTQDYWNKRLKIASEFMERHIIWLEKVCNMRWKTPFDPNPIQYTVGQPMGMLGSFPILDISNYLLASYSDPSDSKFAIVGDDIVWEDKSMMDNYINIATNCGIDISLPKTYENGLAQAVGREITSRFTALPLKFSKHRTVNDIKYQMWYCALYPKLVKKYRLPNGKTVPITNELITKEVQNWHNQTYIDQITYEMNQYNWDKTLFKANFESSIDILISNSKEIKDLRTHNHGSIKFDKTDEVDLIKSMLTNSGYTLSKLAAVNMKTNPILSEKDYVSNTKIAKAEISKSVPHAVNDLYPIVRNRAKSKQANGKPTIDDSLDEIESKLKAHDLDFKRRLAANIRKDTEQRKQKLLMQGINPDNGERIDRFERKDEPEHRPSKGFKDWDLSK